MNRKIAAVLSGIGVSGLIVTGSLSLMADQKATKSCGGSKSGKQEKVEKSTDKQKSSKQNNSATQKAAQQQSR